jgi:protein TonB
MTARSAMFRRRTEGNRGSAGKRFPAWILPALCAALGINAVLFLLLPLLTQTRVSPVVGSEPVGVNLVRLPEPDPPPEEEPPRPPPEPRKPVLSDAFQPELLKPRFEKLEMPTLNLRVDSRLVGIPSDIGLKLFYDAQELDQPPQALAKVPPLYPYKAKRMEIEGFVKVRFLVDEKGKVSRITILESEPEGMFESSVMRILPAWKFTPGKIMGAPVSSWVVTTIRFELG